MPAQQPDGESYWVSRRPTVYDVCAKIVNVLDTAECGGIMWHVLPPAAETGSTAAGYGYVHPEHNELEAQRFESGFENSGVLTIRMVAVLRGPSPTKKAEDILCIFDAAHPDSALHILTDTPTEADNPPYTARHQNALDIEMLHARLEVAEFGLRQDSAAGWEVQTACRLATMRSSFIGDTQAEADGWYTRAGLMP